MLKRTKTILFAVKILLLTSIFGNTLIAQTIDDRFHFPNALRKPLAEHQTGVMLSGHVNRVQVGTVWNIFTNRDGVRGYRNSNLTGVSESFDFLEGFVVVREEANVIRAVHHEYVQMINLLPGHEENTFWFDKRDMLLSRNAMVNNQVLVGEYVAEFNRKAMVINRLDMTADEIADRGFFDRPALDASRLAEARSFSIYFVYNEDGNYLLLGDQQRVSQGNVRQRIRGWVHKQFLSEWNHHLALEMNWENAVGRPPAAIFSRLSDAHSYSRDPNHEPPPPGQKIFEESPPYASRADGELNRFFVLTEGIDMDNTFPEVGYVGEATLEGLEDSECIISDLSPEMMAQIRRKITEGIQHAQRVNILFVIDATTSMERFGEPIVEQLETTMRGLMAGSGLDTLDVDLEYHLGAFIFRDEDEPKPFAISNNGEWTDDISIITALLDKEMRPEHNTRANLTHPEALFHAMHHSVRTFRPNPSSTNYMILIGDAGDNPNSYPNIRQQDVVNILDEYNFNLLAYQMHHRTDFTGRLDDAYTQYQKQISEIIEELALRRNRRLHRTFNDFLAGCPDPGAERVLQAMFENYPLQIEEDAFIKEVDPFFGITSKRIRSELYPIIAQFVFPEDDSTITEDDLGEDLRHDLQNIAIHTAEFLTNMALDGYGADEINTARLIFFGLQMGLSLQEVLTLIFEFDEVYDQGFTAYMPAWLDGSPLYHYVAFMGHNEIHDIARYIDELIPGGGPSIQTNVLRERIYGIWERILVLDLSLVIREDFHNQTIAQNITYLTGLPSPAVYKQYSNADILIPSVFSDSLLLSLCMDLIITRGHLLSIIDGGNMFDRTYFRYYRGYINEFLNMNNMNIRTMDFVDQLVNHFGRLQYAYYPRKIIQPQRPNRSQFWFYWIDARLLPSEVNNPANIVLELAGSI